MKSHLAPYRFIAAALMLSVCLSSQAAGESTIVPAAEGAAQKMDDALKLRVEIADSVAAGRVTADEAIGRLRTAGRITGLDIDPDADFAYGTIDIGRRLIAAKPELAGKFLQAAEQSLEAVIQRTPDDSAKDKAGFLCQLALIRCDGLGKVTQARKDMDRAIALQPKDQYLRQVRGAMANSHAEDFGANTTEVKP